MTEEFGRTLRAANEALSEADATLRQVETVEERRHTQRRQPGRLGGRRLLDLPPDYVSVTEYAYRHSVDRRTVYKWMAAGLLEFYRVDLLIRIRNTPPRAETSVEGVLTGTS